MKKTTKPSNRDVVLKIATSLFLERGFQVTSMDDIVAASKVSKTNIYYHFKSKEELLTAIVKQMTGRYDEMIRETAAQTHLPVTERISRMTAHLAEQQPHSLGGCPFLTIYIQTAREYDFVREEISGFFRMQIATLEKLLQEGIDRGEFNAQLPAPHIAALIVSAIEGGLFLQHTGTDTTLLSNVMNTLALMLK